MNISANRKADAKSYDATTGSAPRAATARDESAHPSRGSAPMWNRSGQDIRKIWYHRRWVGVTVIAVTLLLTLLMHGISERTALMAAGTLLAFALSADRLDHIDE